jgi:hypothetical protein
MTFLTAERRKVFANLILSASLILVVAFWLPDEVRIEQPGARRRRGNRFDAGFGAGFA